jgi:hypothetical protein
VVANIFGNLIYPESKAMEKIRENQARDSGLTDDIDYVIFSNVVEDDDEG